MTKKMTEKKTRTRTMKMNENSHMNVNYVRISPSLVVAYLFALEAPENKVFKALNSIFSKHLRLAHGSLVPVDLG